MTSVKLWVVFAIIFVQSSLLIAQTAPNYENGWKPFGSYDGSHLDTVNLMNGNVMLHAPIIPDVPERGAFTLSEILYTSSKDWQVVCVPKPTGPLMCSWKNGGSQLQAQLRSWTSTAASESRDAVRSGAALPGNRRNSTITSGLGVVEQGR